MYSYATRGLGFLVCCAAISRQLGQGRLRSGGSPLFMINHRSSYVTVSGKTTLLAEIEKVGFLLPMDSINTRLCCGTSS